jgi:hypothetical protein
VFCPRCGTENAADNRFCVSCGSQLGSGAASPKAKASVRERRTGMIGRSRKERLITAGTVVAVVVAVVAFLVIDSDTGDETPAPPAGADVACIQAKQAAAKAATQARGQGQAGFQSYSAQLIAALLDFRNTVLSSATPSDAATELELALRDAAIDAGGLSRLARDGADGAVIARQARALDSATNRVDTATEAFGLTNCAHVRIVPASPQQG